MEKKEKDKSGDRKQTGGERENFYALVAVILNKEMNVDSAIKYFNL